MPAVLLKSEFRNGEADREGYFTAYDSIVDKFLWCRSLKACSELSVNQTYFVLGPDVLRWALPFAFSLKGIAPKGHKCQPCEETGLYVYF